jgi:hypothetical protein
MSQTRCVKERYYMFDAKCRLAPIVVVVVVMVSWLAPYAIVVVMMMQPSLCQIEKGKRMRGIRKSQTLERSRTPVIPDKDNQNMTQL